MECKNFKIFRLDSSSYAGHCPGEIYQLYNVDHFNDQVSGYSLFGEHNHYCTFRIKDVTFASLHKVSTLV